MGKNMSKAVTKMWGEELRLSLKYSIRHIPRSRIVHCNQGYRRTYARGKGCSWPGSGVVGKD